MSHELQTTGQAQPPSLRIADTVAVIKQNVQMVQHVMREVMKPEVHYGKIPGTDKPSLLQPGAEIICLAFHWSTKYTTEDLSCAGVVRYRVTCDLYNRDTGEFVGSGQGEASSDEEKYLWRKAICDAEFNEAAEDRRRVAWKRGKGGSTYQVQQVRIQPADIANTVLKMANKRGHIAATRTASGCSDMFAQDLEDMPEEVRESVLDQKPEPPVGIGPKNWERLVKQACAFGYTEEDVLATAVTAGHEGEGESVSEDLAKRIYQGMKSNPKPKEEAPAPEPTGGFATPLMGDD